MELGRRKDFPSLQWVSPTLLALQHLLQVWDLPQSPWKGQGRGRVAFNMSTNVLTETTWRVLSWLLGSFPHTKAEEAEPAGLGRVPSPLPLSTQGARGVQYICHLWATLGREGAQAWVEKTVLAQSEHELSRRRRSLGGRKKKKGWREAGRKPKWKEGGGESMKKWEGWMNVGAL